MTSAEYNFSKALEYERNEKYLHALQIYKSLLVVEGYEKQASIRLSVVYEKLNKLASSTKVLEEYHLKYPDDIDFTRYYSHFLIQNSDYKSANNLLAKIDISEYPEFCFLLGITNFYLNDFEVARINFLEFVSKNKSDLVNDANLFLAKINVVLQNYDEALEYCKLAEEIFGNNFDLLLLRSQIFFAKGMHHHAYENIREAIKLNAGNTEAIVFCSRILLEIEDFEKAEKLLLDITDETSKTAEFYTLLGLIKIKTNKLSEAENFFQTALELNPEYEEAVEGKIKLEQII